MRHFVAGAFVTSSALALLILPPRPIQQVRLMKHRLDQQQHWRGANSRSVDLRLAPSGIDGLPLYEQTAIFFGIYALLGASTLAGISLTAVMKQQIGLFRAYTRTWFVLGAIFALAGYAHFAINDAFTAIYPPPSTWGIWYLPGSAQFHVAWTGVCEILGGVGLVVGGLARELKPESGVAKLAPISAAALFALTLAVTPANIYMYTHGATMIGAGPDGPLPVEFHYVRFLLQIVLLTILGTVASEERLLPKVKD